MGVEKRTIGIRELKAHASEVVHQVATDGGEFVITVRGRPVARIEPVPHASDASAVDGMGNTRGILAGYPPGEWEDFEAIKRMWEPRLLEP